MKDTMVLIVILIILRTLTMLVLSFLIAIRVHAEADWHQNIKNIEISQEDS